MSTKCFRGSNVRQIFIRGLLESGCCWSIAFTGSLKAAGFERDHTDPCVFRGFVHREEEACIDVLWTMISALRQLSGSWRAPWQNGAHNSRTNQDFGDLTYFVGRHIPHSSVAERASTGSTHVHLDHCGTLRGDGDDHGYSTRWRRATVEEGWPAHVER